MTPKRLWFRQTIAHQWDTFQTKETTTHRLLSHQFTFSCFGRIGKSKHVNFILETFNVCVHYTFAKRFFAGNKPQNKCNKEATTTTASKKQKKKTRTWMCDDRNCLKLWIQSKPKKLCYFGNQIIIESKRCARKMLFKWPIEYVWSNLKITKNKKPQNCTQE